MDISLNNPFNLPYTIAYGIRKQEQIDSFMELDEKKRPPRNIWHNDYKINAWLEEVFSNKDPNASMEFDMNEVD
jgi:hypothetical protein